MRLLLAFFIGMLGCFYLSEFTKRIIKRPIPTIFGLILIIIGFAIGLVSSKFFLTTPLDILIGLFTIGSGVGIILYHLLSERYIISETAEHKFIRRHETKFERALEILPGALVWIVLTSPFWLSLTLPFVVAYLIIIADIYWLLNAIKISVTIYIGYRKMEWAKKQPWLSFLKRDFEGKWEDYYHLVLLPIYNEGFEVVQGSFDGVANSNYPKDKLFLAVGFEERIDPKVKHAESLAYLEKLKSKIGDVFTSFHPANLPGEIPGPGTNRNWMVNNALKELKKKGIKPEQVIVTTLDSDFVVHPEFLAGALHKYLSTPEDRRDKCSYTGVFLYLNNYWQTPAPMRLIATGTAFWQLSEQVSSDKYINYASLSINMRSLLDIGLWIPNKVNDDSGFFWKAYYHFKGEYKVIPHYIPLTADAVLDVNLPKTFQNQYLQLKRWAYGAEHIPFIVKQYFLRTDIDFWNKTSYLTFILWSYAKWGTLAIFITFGGLFITWLNPNYSQSAVAINQPIISSWILTAAFLGLFTTVYVHEKVVPPRPKNWGILTRIWSYLQWLLVPLVLVTIGTIPAIDAQTSLMLGRYIEYRTTNKARVTS